MLTACFASAGWLLVRAVRDARDADAAQRRSGLMRQLGAED